MTNGMVWRRQTLQNGLRVLSFPRQTANTAQLSVAVEYGSNHEPEEIAGVAHYLEHMLAGGSTKRIRMSRSIEDSGGILDFYTDHEHMMSTMDILPEELPEASEVISDLLFSTDFEEEKFGRERKIILNELAEALDDPTERVEELLMKSLFKNHPVRRPVGGYPKTVKQLTLKQLSDAQNANYIPENMIVVLAGNFSEQTRQTVLKPFEDKNAKKPPSKKAIEPETAKPEPLVVKQKSGIAQAYLSIGARTVGTSHKDTATLDVLSAILSGGTSSRLFIELREKNALTYDASSDHNKGVDFGFLSIDCAVKEKNLPKAQNLILKELSKLKTEKVAAEELERSKNLICAEILRGMDNPHETSEIIAYMEIQFRSERALEDYVGRVKAVSSDGIMDVANRYLGEENLATVILKPKNDIYKKNAF
jgi:predicted Zn-dependent peptidase